jgi:hypothetical protein
MREVKARLLEFAQDGGSENWIMFELLAARYFV